MDVYEEGDMVKGRRSANWTHIIKIGDLIFNDDLTFEQKRDGIVSRLRESDAMSTDNEQGVELGMLVDDLADTPDVDTFDWVMSDIYDLADAGKWLWVGP